MNIRSQNELVATAVLTLALYLRFDWDTKDFIRLLEAEFLWTGCYLLMASCAMTMFASVVGCCTIGQARPNLIAMNALTLSILLLVELAGLAYSLDWGTLKSKITDWMGDKMLQLIDVSNTDASAARVLFVIQEKFYCVNPENFTGNE